MDKICVYVDVDDTLVNTIGQKRIPMPQVIAKIRGLFESGATLYCWSTGGAEYASNSAIELGIESIFVEFLPKPRVILDDQPVNEWRECIYVHPPNCNSIAIND